METIFLISLFVILYTYIGYGAILYVLVTVRKWLSPAKSNVVGSFTPTVTLIVAAYNEAGCIEEKIKNCLSLLYPAGKLAFIFVTDGSTDETPIIIARYPQIQLLHSQKRIGKIMSVHRAIKEVTTEVVVFTDANTLLNSEALRLLCRHYADEKTGAVAGEKRIDISGVTNATAGEGLYWKYESKLKKWESEWYVVMGAAGELFSIRAALYEPVAPDTILDDFMISITIAMKGYRIRYEPAAFATEKGSVTIEEELKRKLRIAAGAVQSFLRLGKLLFSVTQPLLSFQYVSHRVLRWLITPYLLVLVFLLNGLLLADYSVNHYLSWLFFVQLCWYTFAGIGWIMEKCRIKAGLFFIPYYFCLMNYAMIAGMIRYVTRGQTVLWEKAQRN